MTDQEPNKGELISEGLVELEKVMPTEKSKKIVGISAIVAQIGGIFSNIFRKKK